MAARIRSGGEAQRCCLLRPFHCWWVKRNRIAVRNAHRRSTDRMNFQRGVVVLNTETETSLSFIVNFLFSFSKFGSPACNMLQGVGVLPSLRPASLSNHNAVGQATHPPHHVCFRALLRCVSGARCITASGIGRFRWLARVPRLGICIASPRLGAFLCIFLAHAQ